MEGVAMSEKRLREMAYGHRVFEESSAMVDDAEVARLAELLERAVKDEQEWWHKRWHWDTGIPCDGSSSYCPLAARRKELQ
jgi:hypothetical protein